MGLIVKNVALRGDKGSAEVETLFDTGASMSFIRKDIAAEIATIASVPQSIRFEMGEEGSFLEVNEGVLLSTTIQDVVIQEHFFVVERLSEKAIIGAKTMQFWKITLDPEKEEISIDPRAARLKLV